MSAIGNYLTQILTAVYGKDVRQAIHDAISQCYDDVSSASLNTDAFKTALADAIEDGTLTALNVADASITTEKLADGSVTSNKLAASSVSTAKIVDAAVNTAKLLDLAVTAAKIADGAVTFDKLSEEVQQQFTHFDNDVATLQTLYKSLNNNVSQVIDSAKSHANGFAFGEDGLLYLTHDGEIISDGLQVASGSGSGLSFNSGYQDEEGYIHLTLDGEDIEGFDPFLVAGGSSGGSVGSKLVFAMYSASTFSVLSTSETANVKFRFASTDVETGVETGSGYLAIYVGGVLKETRTIAQGDNTLDIFSYLATGSNTVKLTIADSYGASATRTLTITLESFTLEWNLGDTEKNTGDLTVYVTPTGSGTKTLYLLIDGTEYETRTVTTSGRQITFTVSLSNGAHTVSVYGTMVVSSVTLTSDTLTCEVAQTSESYSGTVIAAKLTEDEFDQYATISIPHRVINQSENPVSVSYLVNNEVIATDSLDQTEHIWTYRATTAGTLKLGIKSGSASWSKSVEINSLSAEIEEVTDDLALKIDPNEFSDIDAFSYEGVTLSVSNGFDSHNGGIQTDDDGLKCIKVTKGNRLTINYNLFGTDARINGREMKFIYKVENASDFDGEVISCKNGNIGLIITANSVSVTTEQSSLSMTTCEGTKTELELNIEPDSSNKLMMFWEKGTPYETTTYATNDNFKQTSPVGITVGSDTCDVILYLVRVYTRNLTTEEIKANFIADASDPTEIVSRNDRNEVYDSAGKLDPDLVATMCPKAHVLTWHGTGMSEAKSQQLTGMLTHKYVSGGASHYWTAYNATQKAQGTSSLGYVDAGCNEDFSFSEIELEDGTTQETYSMTDDSIGVNYLNFKTNVASQEHINNIILAEWYNKYQPYTRAAKVANSKVRDTVEGHMAILFFHNTGDSAVTMGGVSVQPDETVLYSLGCLNNSKKNDEVFAYDDIVIEIGNNISDQCRFKSDDLTGEDFSGDVNFEFRYLNEDKYTTDEAKAIFQEFLSWVVSCDADNATNTSFGTEKTINGQVYTIDSADYRKAKYAAEAADHMVMDSFLYHQVFTLTLSLVDNRSKNVFIGYESDTGLWNVNYAYDMDTAMGNNNEGDLTLKYGYMDTDTIGTRDVFNAADNTIWCMNRYCFADELNDMYVNRESAGAWDLEALADLCDEYQEMICESVWIEDAWRKNINTYTLLGSTTYLSMMHGKKRLQRRNFLTYQRAFMSSYFVSSYATSDSGTIRGYTPSSWGGVEPASYMTITPYSDLWVTVKAGSSTYQARATAGEAVKVSFGSLSMNDTEIYVRNAGFISDIGSIAHLYPGYIDLSPFKRLQRLEAGSSEDGFSNTNLTSINVSNAVSLEYINVENSPNLVQELDLSGNLYVKECYTRGSGVTGITFAAWGRLVTAYLNAVTSIYASYLNFVEEFTLESYDNLTTLNIVASVIDTLAIVMAATYLTRVRLKEMVWSTTVSAYKSLMALSKIDGIDDDGHNQDMPVVTGSCYFDGIGITKHNALVEALPDMEFTYGTELEEHTGTFVNEDGTVLYVGTTEHLGTLEDPVEEGYIDPPTKEADTEYVYTFYKWDVSLENIAADITITATYSRAGRENTVTFVNDDGTVLETYVVAAHGSCSYSGADLTKSGYIWIGWDQDTSDVIEDMTVTAVYIYPTLPAAKVDVSEYDYAYSDDESDSSAYTFAEFYTIQKMGLTADYFPVGTRCKYVPSWDIITDTSIIYELVSEGHYELVDGGMSNADWYMVGLLTATRQMNSTNVNEGGWDTSAMRTWLNGTFYQNMPPKWRNLIAKSITLANAGNQSETITASEDYFRLYSHAEVGFDTSAVPYKNEISSNASEVTFSTFTDNNSRVKKTFNGEGATAYWWLRSADASSSTNFRNVGNSGNAVNYNAATNSYGVCAGFSV